MKHLTSSKKNILRQITNHRDKNNIKLLLLRLTFDSEVELKTKFDCVRGRHDDRKEQNQYPLPLKQQIKRRKKKKENREITIFSLNIKVRIDCTGM